MSNIFEILDRKGRKVILSQEDWKHIVKHKGIEQHIEDIKTAILNPTIARPHMHDSNKENFYLYFKETKRYLLVSVKYLNNEGEVKTSFITRKIMRK